MSHPDPHPLLLRTLTAMLLLADYLGADVTTLQAVAMTVIAITSGQPSGGPGAGR